MGIWFDVAWMALPTPEAQPSLIVAIKSKGFERNMPQGPSPRKSSQSKLNSNPLNSGKSSQLSSRQLNSIRIKPMQFNWNQINPFQLKWSQVNSKSNQGKLSQLKSCQANSSWFNSAQLNSTQFSSCQANSSHINSTQLNQTQLHSVFCGRVWGFVLWVAASRSDASAKTGWDSKSLNLETDSKHQWICKGNARRDAARRGSRMFVVFVASASIRCTV